MTWLHVLYGKYCVHVISLCITWYNNEMADNYFTEHNHIFFPDLLQVTLTKEDMLADQVKVQVRVQMGARTHDVDAIPGHTEPPAVKRECIEADKSHSYQAMMQILGG